MSDFFSKKYFGYYPEELLWRIILSILLIECFIF